MNITTFKLFTGKMNRAMEQLKTVTFEVLILKTVGGGGYFKI